MREGLSETANPRVEVLTTEDCLARIARALDSIHERVDEDELRRRVESGDACWREQETWEIVSSYRWLLEGVPS